MTRPLAPTLFVCTGLALLMLVGGCVSMPRSSQPPSAKVSSLRRDDTNDTTKVTATVLGAEIGRFADELNVIVAQAADTFAAQVGTSQARALAWNWRCGAVNNSLIIASGANPIANLLDMVVMVTLGRMSIEDHWVPRYGKAAEPMLEATRQLEAEIWVVAARVLTPSQQEELRGLIRAWRAKHPYQMYVGVRLRDFSEIAASGGGGSSRKPGSVFGLLFLDPFAGLDPATREMQQTRYFGERVLFVLERLPALLRLQSELLVYQSLATTDVQQALTNTTRFVQTAEQLAQTIQKLPDQLSAEREKLMKDAVAQAPQWQALMAQFETSLKAGHEMAASVNAATKSLDAFVDRFDRKRVSPTPAGPSTNTVAAALPAPKRFDVTEYGAAASEVANAAKQLDALVSSLEKTTPQLNRVVERTKMEGKELVDYTFHKALWFVALSLAALLLVLLVYRFLAVRLVPKTPMDQPRS